MDPVIDRMARSKMVMNRNTFAKSFPYFIGGCFCLCVACLYYMNLGLFTFALGFFGLILIERSITVVFGIKTK